VTGADRHLERWFVHHRVGWLNPVFEGLSYAGRLGVVWIAIALVLALAWRRWGVLVLTVLAVAVTDLAARGLKDVFDVERPSQRYVSPKPLLHTAHDPSFPSGHASTSFAAATILTSFAPRAAPLWFLLALAIGFSRVYVGVHYPLDIAGGAVLGVVVATALRRLVTVRQRSRAATRSG
jgi:undecaprenyl-diphosphatase